MHTNYAFFGEVFARAVNEIDGLLLVHVPVSVVKEIPRTIVDSANRLRKRDDGTPYSILVSRNPTVPSRGVKEVSIAEAIRYRQGDRLVVLHADSADLESFSGVYRTIIGPEFPEKNTEAIGKLAATAAQMLVPDTSISTRGANAVADELRYSMIVAIEVLRHSFDPQGNWVARWYEITAEAFENISKRTGQLGASKQPISPAEFAESIVQTSFGLPKSNRSERAAALRTKGKKIATALESHWSSGDEAWASDAQIQESSPTSFHSERQDWDGFDLSVAENGSVYRALQAQILEPQGRNFEKFQAISLEDFCSPDGRPEVEIDIFDISGNSVSVSDGRNSWNILKTNLGPDGVTTQSEPVKLRIRLRGTLSDSDLKAIEPSVKFIGEKIQDDNYLYFVGHFEWTQIAQRRRAKKYPLTIESHEPERVASALGNPLATMIVLPPEASSVIAFEIAKNGDARAKLHFLPNDATVVQDEESLALNNVATYSIIIHAINDLIPTIDGKKGTQSRTGIFVAKQTVEDQTAISIGDQDFHLYVADEGDDELSPILAAARRRPLSRESLEISETSNDVRHKFEKHLLEQWEEGKRLSGTGHVFGSEYTIRDQVSSQIRFIDKGDFTEFGPRDRQQFESLKLEYEFRSEEFNLATQAFMDAAEKILDIIYREDDNRFIISRMSLSHLWTDKRAVLDEYLETYTQLVDVGKRVSGEDYRMATFLASFPFSISVWQNDVCKSVLLSPLHPIRLAWLASTEDLLARATEGFANDFLGVLEGWQFPYLASGHTAETSFIAVPTTAGHRNLFLGWSMMTALPFGNMSQVEPPSNVSGFPPPDTATSGLTGSAVSSALRDFLKVNPFITNLSVDLAADTETRRIADIDSAVIGFYKFNSQNRQYSLRGLEIFDSVNRQGVLPSEEILETHRASGSGRLTWNRYSVNDSPQAMVRIQQDAIMRISSINRSKKSPTGVAHHRLTRRFMGEAGYLKERNLYLRPMIDFEEGHDSSVLSALQMVESTFEGSLRLRPNQQSHVENRSWWTISGEALAFPYAIQELLPEVSKNSSTIWEWRPPFFDADDSTTDLANRAYLILAKIPTQLRDRIDKKLSRIPLSSKPFSSTDVFKTLGAQGIGLASLLSIGGHQASGAIGFYLALTLCGKLDGERRKRLVLPIDACQRFLDLLSGNKPDASKHRADLLLFDIGQDSVQLVPIEVKMYGLETRESNPMPGLRSPEVREALEQTARSRTQLQNMVEHYSEIASIENENWEADSLLWNTAFASLVETAIKLGQPDQEPRESSLLKTVMNKILSGDCQLSVHDGIALIFNNTGESDIWLDDVDKESGIQIERLTPGAVFNVELLSQWIARFNGGNEEDQLPHEAGAEAITFEVSSVDNGHDTTPKTNDSSEAVGKSNVSEECATYEKPEVKSTHSPDTENASTENLRDDCDFETGKTLRSPGVKFNVGRFTDSFGSSDAELWLGNTRLNQLNIGVVGDLGTGKTQLVKSLIYQIRKSSAETQANPVEFLIFDYKSDYGDKEFLDSVGGERIPPRSIPLSLFDLGENPDSVKMNLRIGTFIDVLQKIYSGIGPVQRQQLTSVIQDIYRESVDSPPTLSRIVQRYEEEYRVDSVISVLRPFVDFEIFDENPENTVPFEELIKGKVLVLDLNGLGTNTNIKNSLVTLLLNLYYEYMKGITKHDFLYDGENQIRNLTSYVVVDEANQIMKYEFDVLKQILLEGREFGVGVMLSTQYLSHFNTKSHNWAEPLLTWFVHKVPMVKLIELSSIGVDSTKEKANAISNLDPHYALYKSLDVQGEFILGTPYYKLVEKF